MSYENPMPSERFLHCCTSAEACQEKIGLTGKTATPDAPQTLAQPFALMDDHAKFGLDYLPVLQHHCRGHRNMPKIRNLTS
jgi:hypothetical protein